MKLRFSIIGLIVLTSASTTAGELSKLCNVSEDAIRAISSAGDFLIVDSRVEDSRRLDVHDLDAGTVVGWSIPLGAYGQAAISNHGQSAIHFDGSRYRIWRRENDGNFSDRPIVIESAPSREAVAMSADGQVFAAIVDGGVRVTDVAARRSFNLHNLRNEVCTEVQVTPDGKYVAVLRLQADGEYPGLSIVGTLHDEIKFETAFPRFSDRGALAISANAEIAVVAPPPSQFIGGKLGERDRIVGWNTVTKQPLPELLVENAAGARPILSNDGKMLAFVHRYYTTIWLLRIYDLSTNQLLDELHGKDVPRGGLGRLFSTAFVGDSYDLRFVHSDGTVYTWKPNVK